MIEQNQVINESIEIIIEEESKNTENVNNKEKESSMKSHNFSLAQNQFDREMELRKYELHGVYCKSLS